VGQDGKFIPFEISGKLVVSHKEIVFSKNELWYFGE
jgi:hypothetical protein